jgi:hypothetical protein
VKNGEEIRSIFTEVLYFNNELKLIGGKTNNHARQAEMG